MTLATSAALGVTLERAALEQFQRAVAAGCPLQVNSSYRDPKMQAWLFEDNYTPEFSVSAKHDRKTWNGRSYWRRTARRSNGATTVSVAVPGTSEHEVGRALDLGVDARAWMRANGRPFGWIWPEWAQQVATYEPWHVEFVASLVTPPNRAPEEDDVAYPYRVNDKHLYLLAPGSIKHFTDAATAEFVKNVTAANDAWVPVTGEQFLTQLDSFGIPRTAVDVSTGAVMNPETGRHEAGAFWSWARIAATRPTPAAAIDLAAIAKAVNDDAARRLAQ